VELCRSCRTPLGSPFLSLGAQPLSNNYLREAQLREPETRYPLDVRLCPSCWLVQIDELGSAQAIFGDEYPYFASFSDSWLAHCRAYTEMAIARFGLDARSFVLEAASNDGYLLQYFVARGIPVLGVEPARSVATAAIAKGVPTEVAFFTTAYASAMTKNADLIIANNVLAHVPDINDFVGGISIALAPAGVATLEFPHLLRTLEGNQFDTVYHEHYSYLSLVAIEPLFERHGLSIFDVEEHRTHGGSLRVFAQRKGGKHPITERVARVLDAERTGGLLDASTYTAFAERAAHVKHAFPALLAKLRNAGKRVAGYGAPAKGNTLLNYCGIATDLIEFTVDRNPLKQGRFLPGSHIPIYAPSKIEEMKPDCVVILPWNLRVEVLAQLAGIRAWGGQFAVPIPEPELVP
jgi:SAM-dependent methyltransferase